MCSCLDTPSYTSSPTPFSPCLLHPPFPFLQVSGRETSRWKPIPLNSVEFAVLASRSLRMDSSIAASIAEDLYSKGYISYPRTETEIYDETIDCRALVAEHLGHPVWGQYCRGLLEGGGFEQPRPGQKHDKAHPPIHPLKSATEAELVSALSLSLSLTPSL